MPSDQDNQAEQIPPQTPQSDEAADDVVTLPADEETTALPGDAAPEPVNAPTVATEPAPLLAVADLQTEQPDGAVQAVDDDDAATDEPLTDDAGRLGLDVPTLEALIFSTHHPLTGGRLAELLDVPSTKPIRKAIRVLNESYQQGGRCFRIEQVAGGFQMLTLADYGPAVGVLNQREADSRLTKAALETLAIIAYKQPILRADVEAIRGVASGETIRSLMEKHLVKIGGRAELPGRPILYGTTKRFLEVFGLNSLRDLPQAENLPKAASRLSSQPSLFEPHPEEAPVVAPAVDAATVGEAIADEPATTVATTIPATEADATEFADSDDQAVNEAVELTLLAAEQEAAAARDFAQDDSETIDEAEPTEPIEPADDGGGDECDGGDGGESEGEAENKV